MVANKGMYCLDVYLRESEADHRRKEWLRFFFCVFDVLLVFSGFRQGRTRVNGGTVDFTTPPSTSLSLSVPHPRSLSLFPLCQTTVSIAVCLPSSKNCLVGNLRHTRSHTNTHTFFPGSDRVQKVMILVHCRLRVSGNIHFLKTYQRPSKRASACNTRVQTG